MKTLEDAVVISNREIRPGIFSMWLQAERICSVSRPGQFVHLRVHDAMMPLLRRPLSIGRARGNELELVWRVVGGGTAALARKAPGQKVDLLGPLGKPFDINRDHKHRLLVGGGLGMPPLVYLYEFMKERGISAELFMGVRDQEAVPLPDGDPLLDEMVITMEKGGNGQSQFITEPFGKRIEELAQLDELARTAVYTCGPWPLARAMQRIMEPHPADLMQVSLEQQMGCGVGVCQGCAVVVQGRPESPFQLVCHDGPVFDLLAVEAPDGI